MPKLPSSKLVFKKVTSQIMVLGGIIGIVAVILLITMAGGFKAEVDLPPQPTPNPDVFYIISGPPVSSGAYSIGRELSGVQEQETTLTLRDAEAIKRIVGVKSVSPEVRGSTKVSNDDQNITVQYVGAEISKLREFIPANIIAGRWLLESDLYSVVIDDSIANVIFKKRVAVGNTIKMDELEFSVVGILNKSSSINQTVFISTSVARELESNRLAPNQIDIIYVRVIDPAQVSNIVNEIKDVLMVQHRVTEDTIDFSIITTTIGNIPAEQTNTSALILGVVAVISLIIGGVGVGNLMSRSAV